MVFCAPASKGLYPLTAAIIPTTDWQGSLHLAYARRDEQTYLQHQRSQAPLKIHRAFYPEGPEVCHSTILHTAGGMVGGDGLDIDIQLAPQSRVLLTTTAAAKIYGSRGRSLVHPEGRPATQTVRIAIAPGACLEWLPQETIAFNGCLYDQALRVDLAETAIWCGWEILRLGRSARGEKFLTGRARSRTEVWQQGKPLWIDAQQLSGDSTSLSSYHDLNHCPVLGTFSWIGCPVSGEIVEQVRACWSQESYQGEAGTTQLISGLLCRYRGNSTAEVRHWFTAVWQILRQTYADRPICLPRIWQRDSFRH